MTRLVTVEQVNNALHLDLDTDVGDASYGDGDTARLDDIELKIDQAQDAIADYLKDGFDPYWTSDTVPGRVSAAIILLVEALLDGGEHGSKMLSGLSGGSLDNPVVALLYRTRDPSIA